MGSMDEKSISYNVGVTALHPRSESSSSQQQQKPLRRQMPKDWKRGVSITNWTPAAFLVSYFVFSIALYTIINDEATKIFWFLYLTIGTLVAGITTLEAYDGLTPLTEARKAIAKVDADNGKWKVTDEKLTAVDLVFDRTGDAVPSEAIGAIEHCVKELTYPGSKMRAFALVSAEYARESGLSLDGIHNSAVNIVPVPMYSSQSLSSRLAHFFGQRWSTAPVTALFTGEQLPHPHAVRIASERLAQDAKIDVLQGRAVYVPPKSKTSVFAAMTCMENDLFEALLYPGRGDTWGVKVPSDSNAYWCTDIIRDAATLTAQVQTGAYDLGFASARNGARAAYDLRVVAHEPCPRTFSQYWQMHIARSRQLFLATMRYTRISVRKASAKENPEAPKWTLKKRFGVLYRLPITCLVSHAICQYFSLALALLFTQTPQSASEFASTIYWSYPVCEWLILSGVVCLIAMATMTYMAKSEYVPPWTGPLFLACYPLLLLIWAIAGVQGQATAVLI